MNKKFKLFILLFLIPFIKVEAQETIIETVTETITEISAFITVTVAERTIIDIKHNTTITITRLVELTWTQTVTNINNMTEVITTVEESDFLSPQVFVLFGVVMMIGAFALISIRRR